MGVPIRLADVGAQGRSVRVSAWLADPGDLVEEGDSVVEVLLAGMTFDVPSPAHGVLSRITMPLDAVVAPGDILGWVETSTEETTG
jgi:pyruvate/2-oxoglutarate dehydrogenase complex dihydrolipoamide acyltransferase (E2) component